MAERFALPVADKPDSQEICFSDETGHVRSVVAREPGAERPGEIVDLSGAVVGEHQGLVHHTVGQRKGLGIGGLAEPLYVIALDPDNNRVVVGGRDALRVRVIEACDVRWRGGTAVESAAGSRVRAAVRYRMEPQTATAHLSGDSLVVRFDEPLDAVAPGQSVVCYEGDRVLGGGVISCAS
jgi:tRNA-specific 2-thiouridylase